MGVWSHTPFGNDSALDRAADRLAGEDSELAELWDDSDSAGAWRASLAQLQRAVAAG